MDRKTETSRSRDNIQSANKILAESGKGLGKFILTSCMRCGLCTDTCHVYISEPMMANIPAVKASMITRFFRRYHTFWGKYFPQLVGAQDISKEALDEIIETVYGRCTACGRCSIQCPMGLDLRDIIRIGRQLCAATDRVPEGLQRTVDNQLKTGNQMAIPQDELLSTIEWLTDDLKLEMDDDSIRIPVDQKGKKILYLINPREIKFFPLSFMAAAGVFHKAKESWTISSRFYDVTNYGFYSGDDVAAARITRQIMEETERLEVDEIVLSECGHGYRSFRWEGSNWYKQKHPIQIRSILEIMLEYLNNGDIHVDPSKNKDRVTLHDPCNLVRMGGIIEPQRQILRQVVSDFVEMTPNRENNFCCGGGGGMLSMSEYGDRRVLSGKVKADQIRSTDAKIVATPCHNCADQLLELSKKYKLGVDIQAVVELVYNSLE